ncbi:NAD/NADP octopine/nopaline dehydrogenase family protein [Massilia sp. TWR1-2-2]|uniref:NAD/NADP octopine/nopaline dehydrogenase family protein n=1 Tax=Massilia sp. TWR1-2-2 TaxID=2804584 RepID=UPI003CEA71C9
MHACVCGGGAIGHVLAAVLGAKADVSVSVLTRTSQHWRRRVEIHCGDRYRLEGRLHKASDDVAACVRGADAVLLALSAPARAQVLARIAPHLKPGSWVACVGNSIGFDGDARALLGPGGRFLGFQRTPWVARLITPGQLVRVSGVRAAVLVAGAPADQLPTFAAALGCAIGVHLPVSGNYHDVSLAYDNATLHPPRLYSLFGPERLAAAGQGFYRDWDDSASQWLLDIDEELQALRRSLGATGAGSARRHFGVSHAGPLTRLIRSSVALREIGLPVLAAAATGTAVQPDLASRFFQEDIAYGLALQHRMAARAGIETPKIGRLLDWARGAFQLADPQ